MSIIIKGMDMPKSCNNCPMCSVIEWWCDALNRNLVHAIADTGRAEWCPLVEVPTPHGRLADVDAIEIISCKEVDGWHHKFNAPTVIEAERI